VFDSILNTIDLIHHAAAGIEKNANAYGMSSSELNEAIS